MAFADQTRSNHRAATMVVVAALHGAAIYALVTGLAVEYYKEVMPVFEARNIPVQPKVEPPPKPKPQPKAEDPVLTAPKRPIDLPTLRHPIPVPLPPPVPVPRDPVVVLPEPKPVPSFTPKAVKPKGSPADWVTTNDYPARDLREGNQGRVTFSLLVGTNGKPESCVVTGSSGHSGLDEATCRNIMRRARFTPATDENGARVSGTYSSSIRWVIPE